MNIFIPPSIFLLTAISLIAFDNQAPLQNLQDENNKSKFRTPAEYKPLVPTSLMSEETKWLLSALEKAHFNKLNIENLDRKKFLENYLRNLDKQKLFFKLSDVDDILKRYEPTLITYLKQGNLFPAFEIYESYRNRSLSRLQNILLSLDNSPNIDTNKTFLLDRSEEEWPLSEQSLENDWELLITHEFINEIFSQIDENETSSESTALLKTRESKALERLKNKYERWHKNILEFEAADVQELYLTTLTQMFDPHTSFLNIKEKEKFDQAMHNEFVGIGAVLTDSDGYCTIKELLPGGPAEASRELEPEDIILQVAQGDRVFVDVVDMKLSKIVDLIKGPKDTVVILKIRPFANPSTTKLVKILRDKIKLTANLASATLHKIEGDGKTKLLGVIELPSFYGSSGEGHKATDDVEELLNSLKKESMEGLVLDLRRNGGGYLSEAVNLAGLFISRGPIVQVKSSDGKVRKKFDFNPKLAWDGPLVILVSRYSASASEIVAGALKNHRRAIIVGDISTHGKGTVQSLIPMNLPYSFTSDTSKKSAAKITIQKYYLPSGESTQLSGVKSDIVMHSVNKYLPIGESDLDEALPWDKIPEVNFRRPEGEFKYAESTLKSLITRSKSRQNKEKEFKYLEKNISWFKQKREQKRVSLNLNDRLLQKEHDLNKTRDLTEEFESLFSISFPSRKLFLQVVTDQKEKSLAIRGLSGTDENASSQEFIVPENLDIRLHESLRILSDWINDDSISQSAHAYTQEIKKI
jgi:carboxyl-terminal processing protease